MENENRLNYLKYCYKEIFSDPGKENRQWIKHICLENSYNYLMERARKAKTEREFNYFKAILNHYVELWKGNNEAHVIVLYSSDERELLLWMEFDLLYVEIPSGEVGDMTCFDLAYSFSEHEITVKGKPYTIERYLDSIGFDYSYKLED
ncbi:MAG: hypothetical protein IJ057_13100 [Bacteroidales bacterium]|nr:hypothetical protein [Bacteroidales bacterium]